MDEQLVDLCVQFRFLAHDLKRFHNPHVLQISRQKQNGAVYTGLKGGFPANAPLSSQIVVS